MRASRLHKSLAAVLAGLLLYSSLFPTLALAGYVQRDGELDQVLGESITICTDQGMVQMGLDEYRLRLQLGHSLAWTDALLHHGGPALLPAWSVLQPPHRLTHTPQPPASPSRESRPESRPQNPRAPPSYT